MNESPDTHANEESWSHGEYSEPPYQPDILELHLEVTDPELITELAAYQGGRAREEFALTALRIGVLALKQAQGRLDADTVRTEGDRLMAELGAHLQAHREAVTGETARSLREYFDPASGRFNERLERLLKDDGELENVLQRQIGADGSELAKTLAAHLGESSPLMRLLDPEASSGFLRALQQGVDQALKGERETLLREFSLDNRESALSRLVRELTERHGKLTEGLQGSIKEVVGEFSLDNDDSALSRLVKRVDQAQKRISDEFSLDSEASALARMKREMLEILSGYRQDSVKFQQEVMTALGEMKARKEEASRSTTHGDVFEVEVFRYIQQQAQHAGDVASHVGHTTGLIKNSKVGDATIELGPEHAAAGARVVIEAKESASYDLAKARAEIDIARKNRAAEVGLFVFSRRTAPEGQGPLVRMGHDIFVIWDAEQVETDVFLDAAISVARAICTRSQAARAAGAADFEAIERAVRDVEKQALGLEEITRYTETIKSNSERILKRSRIVREALISQVGVLDAKLSDLKTVLITPNNP